MQASKDVKEQSAQLSYLGQDLELGKAPCHRLGQLGARSQPELPLKFEVHDSAGSELCLGDRSHGMETVRPVPALEETDFLERPQCLPPKP